MNSLNKIIIVGNVGKTPEIRLNIRNHEYAVFSVAVTERWLETSNGNYKEKTDWFSIKVHGKLCEVVKKSIDKGTKLLVDGRLCQYDFINKEDERVKGFEIVAQNFIIIHNAKAPDDSIETTTKENKGIDDEIPF